MSQRQAASADFFLDIVEALVQEDERLTPLSASVLAALRLGIADDTMRLAKTLGIAHALVLREVDFLSSDFGKIEIVRRDERTQRTFYRLAGAADAGAACDRTTSA